MAAPNTGAVPRNSGGNRYIPRKYAAAQRNVGGSACSLWNTRSYTATPPATKSRPRRNDVVQTAASERRMSVIGPFLRDKRGGSVPMKKAASDDLRLSV